MQWSTHELAACFKGLNLFGYRPEKKGCERSAFLDSSHAGMASFAECLITADEKFRVKGQSCLSLSWRASSQGWSSQSAAELHDALDAIVI